MNLTVRDISFDCSLPHAHPKDTPINKSAAVKKVRTEGKYLEQPSRRDKRHLATYELGEEVCYCYAYRCALCGGSSLGSVY